MNKDRKKNTVKDLTTQLLASQNPLETLYNSQDTPEWKTRFGQTAQLMIQNGLTSELNFLLQNYPDLLITWSENNTDIQALINEFGGSNKWLAWALARTYNLDFDNIYRTLNHSVIRSYLGDFTTKTRKTPYWHSGADTPKVRVIEPNGVNLKDIRRNFYLERDFNKFSRDADTYFKELEKEISVLEDQQQIEVLQEVYGFYQEVKNLRLRSLQTEILDGQGTQRRDQRGENIEFPSNHQKAAIVKAAQEGTLAVFDGTGSGKTGIGVGLVEYINAQKVLVVCPAGLKHTWETRINEYYIDPPTVTRYDDTKSILTKNKRDSKYTIVNYDLVAKNAALFTDYDLLIIDEAHYINNSTKRSSAILELASRIDKRLILTATPIRNSANDLARIAHLLSPDTFPNPHNINELGPSGSSFLSELLANKTIRRDTKDLVELPPFCPDSEGEINFERIHLNPTHQAIYDTIFYDQTISSLEKVRLLRFAAIDPNLLIGKYEVPFDQNNAKSEFQKAFLYWKKTRNGEKFDSDYFVTHGFRHLLIGIHLSYPRGVDQFVWDSGNSDIQEKWAGFVESTKFQYLKEVIREKIKNGEKITIFSGHFATGLTREAIDDVTGEPIMEDLYSYLKREFPQIGVLRIDGEVSTNAKKGTDSERERTRKSWQNDTNNKILLTTVPSSSLGIDLTVNDGLTKGVTILGIDLPYTHADFWQMIARVYRFGQLTPVSVTILEAIRTIDEGVHNLIDKKNQIASTLLDGALPTEIEKQILAGKKDRSFFVDYTNSPKRELEKSLYSMRGKGAIANGAYLETVLPAGKTIGEAIAELYVKYWEYTYSGHTARFVRQVIDGLQTHLKTKFEYVLDAGSGPLVLNKIIKQESEVNKDINIISIDINKHMLDLGAQELERMGFKVNRDLLAARSMSDTDIEDGVCDAVVCSLAFHYSKSDEDRGAILIEANRVLKPGGYYFLTLPKTYITPQQFKNFSEIIKQFGLIIDKNLSGLVQAQDYKDVPFTTWFIALRKAGAPKKKTLSIEEFSFNFEQSKLVEYTEKDEDEENNKPDLRRKKPSDRLVKHEKFSILDPENGLKSKGTTQEVLSRLGLVDEETVRKYGWSVEIKEGKEGPKIIYRNRK